jgi:transcriptional regulator GlxA family with amidase domain
MAKDSETNPIEKSRREWLVAAGVVSGAAAGGSAFAQAPSPLGPRPTAPVPVAILIDKGATLIDFAGPWEVFSSVAYHATGFGLYTVAASRDPIICDNGRQFSPAQYPGAMSGLTVVPDFTFADAPQPKILVVGAQSGANDPAKMAWIRNVYPGLELAMSVCNGAFVLGYAGLLDGRAATANARAYDNFAQTFPKTRVVRGVRFVEDGNVATATGLTAGIDLALRVTDRIYGRDVATQVAKFEEWKSGEWVVNA